jgi:hypothetical protein
VADETLPPAEAPDLGQAAYEAENAWLSKIMPGAQHPSWDELDPEYQEMYRRVAGAVAAAERARIRALADRTKAVCTDGDEGTQCYFSALIAEPS